MSYMCPECDASQSKNLCKGVLFRLFLILMNGHPAGHTLNCTQPSATTRWRRFDTIASSLPVLTISGSHVSHNIITLAYRQNSKYSHCY
jgi:hypothetical protein